MKREKGKATIAFDAAQRLRGVVAPLLENFDDESRALVLAHAPYIGGPTLEGELAELTSLLCILLKRDS